LSSGESPCGREESHRRKTRQRQVILEELQAVTSHPTAVELHELVRRRLPKVSLGTVYRNLDCWLGWSDRETRTLRRGGPLRRQYGGTRPLALRAVRPNRDAPTPPLDLASPQGHDCAVMNYLATVWNSSESAPLPAVVRTQAGLCGRCYPGSDSTTQENRTCLSKRPGGPQQPDQRRDRIDYLYLSMTAYFESKNSMAWPMDGSPGREEWGMP